ncbi:hypothetical protein ACN47E_009521 [Coniothyrium glycines]
MATTDTIDVELLGYEGQRTFHDTDAAYVLPNDNVEHRRLELQHVLLRGLMENRLFHAPLQKEKIQKTLDIGCGTGAVTNEMGLTFPTAKVYGIDLSPVPQVRPKLPNIEYVQGNVMEIKHDSFATGSFDFIYSRLLVLGMSNWQGYVERCVSLLKPGGWIEMHDLSNQPHHVPSPVSSFEHLRPHDITMEQIRTTSHPTDAYQHASPWLWDTTFHKLLAVKHVDLYCGPNIPFLFANAGLVDMTIRRYMMPYSRWDGLTREETAISDYLETFVRDLVPMSIRKAGENAGPEYAAEAERAVEDAKRYHAAYDGGRNFLWMYVVCGRKPE